MAGFSIGEAIAMGITQGIGQGATKVQDQRRQERLIQDEEDRVNKRFQTQRTAQMEDWKTQTEATTRTRREEYQISRKDTVADQQTQFRQTQALQNQRQRFEVSQIAAHTQEAKKLALFNTNLKYISDNVDRGSAYRDWAPLDAGTIAQKLSYQAIKGVPAVMQKEAYQDSMKRLHGMTKQEMLGQAGLIPGDLTPYMNDPAYKDAIPKGYIAGMQGSSNGMDQVFKYSTPAAPEVASDAPASIQLMAKRTEGYATMIQNSPTLMGRGLQIASVDPAVLNTLDVSLGQGDKSPTFVDQTSGIEVNRVDDMIIQGLQKGTMVLDMEGNLMTKNQALAKQALMADMEPMAATQPPSMLARPGMGAEQPAQAPTAQMATMDASQALADVQTGQAQVTEQKVFRRDEAKYKEAEKVSTDIAKNVEKSGVLKMTESATRAKDSIKGASPEVQKELFGAFATSDGDVAEAVRALEKSSNPAAKEAFLILQDLQATQNARILTLGGKAVSEQEAKRFARELGAAGLTGSKAELMRGLDNIVKMGQDEVAGNLEGQPKEAKDIFFQNSPMYQKLMEEHGTYGSPEGKARVAERTQAKAEAETLLKQGASPAEVNQYLQEEYGITL